VSGVSSAGRVVQLHCVELASGRAGGRQDRAHPPRGGRPRRQDRDRRDRPAPRCVALAALSKRLKSACGTGGTVKAGALEFQGDHRELLASLLESEGFRTKLSGG
jgi:hypothetical protein